MTRNDMELMVRIKTWEEIISEIEQDEHGNLFGSIPSLTPPMRISCGEILRAFIDESESCGVDTSFGFLWYGKGMYEILDNVQDLVSSLTTSIKLRNGDTYNIFRTEEAGWSALEARGYSSMSNEELSMNRQRRIINSSEYYDNLTHFKDPSLDIMRIINK